jgi:hypothetical protein
VRERARDVERSAPAHRSLKALANQHPMFLMTNDMEDAIKAFVDAAIAKKQAGLCGK